MSNFGIICGLGIICAVTGIICGPENGNLPWKLTTTHFIPPFRNYSQLIEKVIKIKIKGYQLLEITVKS